MPPEFYISHDRNDESLEAKARWFQSLTVEQRMDIFCELTDMILAAQPDMIRNKPHAEPIPGRIQVLKLP